MCPFPIVYSALHWIDPNPRRKAEDGQDVDPGDDAGYVQLLGNGGV